MEGILKITNGDSFKGNWITETSLTEISGEIVFFTGMTGYQEAITDPLYKDKIVVFTYPLIGGSGINLDDEKVKPQARAVIVYEAVDEVFHYQAKLTLKQYLQKWDVPLLEGIDTRAVVKKIRDRVNESAIVSKVHVYDHQAFAGNKVTV